MEFLGSSILLNTVTLQHGIDTFLIMNRLTHTSKVSEHSWAWTISSVKLIQAGICAVWSVYPLVVWLNKLPFMEGSGTAVIMKRDDVSSAQLVNHTQTHTCSHLAWIDALEITRYQETQTTRGAWWDWRNHSEVLFMWLDDGWYWYMFTQT